MAAKVVTKLRSPPAEPRGPTDARSERLAAVGEAVQLYHDLEQALSGMGDAELGRLAAEARAGERTLAEWARRLEGLRIFKRRFESGLVPSEAPPGRRASWPVATWTGSESRLPPLLLEALAFTVGFIAAFLVTW